MDTGNTPVNIEGLEDPEPLDDTQDPLKKLEELAEACGPSGPNRSQRRNALFLCACVVLDSKREASEQNRALDALSTIKSLLNANIS